MNKNIEPKTVYVGLLNENNEEMNHSTYRRIQLGKHNNQVMAGKISTVFLFNEPNTIDKNKIICEIEDKIAEILNKYRCEILQGKGEYLSEDELLEEIPTLTMITF